MDTVHARSRAKVVRGSLASCTCGGCAPPNRNGQRGPACQRLERCWSAVLVMSGISCEPSTSCGAAPVCFQVAAVVSLSPAAARFFRPALSAACACTISTVAAVGRSSSGTCPGPLCGLAGVAAGVPAAAAGAATRSSEARLACSMAERSTRVSCACPQSRLSSSAAWAPYSHATSL
eukprot:scaffold76561_cov62-Phaeocystis_antarctica.AAC.7